MFVGDRLRVSLPFGYFLETAVCRFSPKETKGVLVHSKSFSDNCLLVEVDKNSCDGIDNNCDTDIDDCEEDQFSPEFILKTSVAPSTWFKSHDEASDYVIEYDLSYTSG